MAIAYAKLYENGTFQTDDGDSGYWEQFGSSIMLQFMNGCAASVFRLKKTGVFSMHGR